MNRFSAEWLALREPADAAARSSHLTRLIADVVPHDPVLQAVDLGSGSGSNVRYLAERLPSPQRWRLVDQDPALLADVPAGVVSWGLARGYEVTSEAGELRVRGERLTCQLEVQRLDLVACDAAVFSGCGLVTASALLDLVSEQWLQQVAALCRERGAAVLFALTYDGRLRCSPEEPEDRIIQDLVNRHQRSDKGFGAALGPDATEVAQRYLASLGYRVETEPSDWVLAPDASALQRHLIEGLAKAAVAAAPGASDVAQRWRARRLAHLDDGWSEIVVGHQDLAAWLPR